MKAALKVPCQVFYKYFPPQNDSVITISNMALSMPARSKVLAFFDTLDTLNSQQLNHPMNQPTP